jgi:hypothetical protein
MEGLDDAQVTQDSLAAAALVALGESGGSFLSECCPSPLSEVYYLY